MSSTTLAIDAFATLIESLSGRIGRLESDAKSAPNRLTKLTQAHNDFEAISRAAFATHTGDIAQHHERMNRHDARLIDLEAKVALIGKVTAQAAGKTFMGDANGCRYVSGPEDHKETGTDHDDYFAGDRVRCATFANRQGTVVAKPQDYPKTSDIYIVWDTQDFLCRMSPSSLRHL